MCTTDNLLGEQIAELEVQWRKTAKQQPLHTLGRGLVMTHTLVKLAII
jgi:hypothetical protein